VNLKIESKTMKRILLSLTALASLTMASTSAFANLGDTISQSIDRFGNATSTNGNWIYFKNEKWAVSEWINPENKFVEYIIWTRLGNIALSTNEMMNIQKRNLPAKYQTDNLWVRGDEHWVRGERCYAVSYTKDNKYNQEAGIDGYGNAYYSVGTLRAKLAIVAENNAQNNQDQKSTDDLTLKLGV
jgi:hypothetical protein